MKWLNEKENLKKLVFVDKKSYEEIGRIYGCTSQNIRKVLKKLGFVLEKRRKINKCETFGKGKGGHKCINENCSNVILGNNRQKFCCNKCQQEYQSNEKYKYYLAHQDEFSNREISYQWLKRIIIIEQNHKCDICGIGEMWNNKELHFILDHIDGDATNNKRDNLRLICPNCDSQLDTYKARNKGRSTRRYKPYHINLK